MRHWLVRGAVVRVRAHAATRWPTATRRLFSDFEMIPRDFETVPSDFEWFAHQIQSRKTTAEGL
eukprot:4814706-Prymnesium_polylepis.1